MFHFDEVGSAKEGRRDMRGGCILKEIGRGLFYGFRMMQKNPGPMPVAVIFKPPIPAPHRVFGSPNPFSYSCYTR
ncbi:MAG: hypothetical protein JXA73_09415 [Acidobacteria bacterium]|nr:hypothetical protein [Acidobacteriota bacterium]